MRGGGLSAAGREPEGGSWMNDFTENESRNPLDSWDYAILEIIRRQDWFAMLEFGTMRLAKSVLKSGLRAMMYVSERKPTLDERERMQAFLDSPALRAYRSNLKKVATHHDQTFFDEVSAVTGFKMFEAMTGAYLPPDAEAWAREAGVFEGSTKLTGAGKRNLEKRSAQARRVHAEIRGMYGRPDFYERALEHESELPLMVAMGMSDAAIREMLAASDAQYAGLLRVRCTRTHAGFGCAPSGGPDAGVQS